ncbi:MAG: thioredoxin [Anaerosomatales bacterium]|nr:thioredoxin [Anaerosomatales bacterium]MDT8434547.1 thioredoxin [Anaerosomatales bacterium]
MSDKVIEVSAAQFDSEVLDATVPVVVDFWAPWCGPCRVVAPEVEKLAGRADGAVKFVKVNIDENRDVAIRYNVMSIPTIAKFERGSVVAQAIGAKGADALSKELGLGV